MAGVGALADEGPDDAVLPRQHAGPLQYLERFRVRAAGALNHASGKTARVTRSSLTQVNAGRD
jgi:hypothetical protein